MLVELLVEGRGGHCPGGAVDPGAGQDQASTQVSAMDKKKSQSCLHS
jgi:hypothetical protein